MQQNVKILAILHIVFGVLGVLGALMMMAIFGGLAGVVQFYSDVAAGSAVLGLIGTVITVFLLVIAAPGLIAGVGLLQLRPWARMLTIVISALELAGFPLHTALGIFGLWVLLSNEGAALFAQQPDTQTT